MNVWHVVRGNRVENVIIWDGSSDYYPGDGVYLKQLGDNVGIGYLFDENSGQYLPEIQTS